MSVVEDSIDTWLLNQGHWWGTGSQVVPRQAAGFISGILTLWDIEFEGVKEDKVAVYIQGDGQAREEWSLLFEKDCTGEKKSQLSLHKDDSIC